jgi:glutaredoxin
MNKKYSLYFIFILAVVFVGIFFFIKHNQQKVVKDNSSTIFFYGDNCPHCANVEKYFQENDVQNRINFEEKEVYKNANNAKILNEKAKKCGIEEKEIGVPLLWTDGKCYVGDEEIIKFFNEKINEKQK